MAEQLYIKPAPGRLVRDPVSGAPLADSGEYKPKTSHWLRRLKDGDVLLADNVITKSTAKKG